jgi:hypothetical protein
MTTVTHKRNKHDVYIGRPSKWGNPFVIGKDGSREQVIAKYAQWIESQPELIAAAKLELKDKVLGCFCHPLPCHGDVLASIVNDPDYCPRCGSQFEDHVCEDNAKAER